MDSAAPNRSEGPSYFRSVSAIVRKDLLIELRTRESVPAMVLFALSTFIVFHFGIGRETLTDELAAGVLWVTLLFAAILGVNRVFVSELEQSRLDGVLLTPVDRTAILIAKAASLSIYLLALELVALPIFALFFSATDFISVLPELVLIALLANLGLAATGCLVAGITVRSRTRELLLPLMMLPLMVPVVIAASQASAPFFAENAQSQDLARWLLLLGLFDTVFSLLAFAVFDYLLDD